LAKNLAVFTQTTANFRKKMTITLVSEKTAYFRKLAKIAENCDHNIDPWSQSYGFELQRQRCKNVQSK
jgi:hypothetical protein